MKTGDARLDRAIHVYVHLRIVTCKCPRSFCFSWDWNAQVHIHPLHIRMCKQIRASGTRTNVNL